MTPGPGYFEFGTQRTPFLNESMREAYERLIPEPPPSLEERVQRCKEMGLILCSCTGVETEQGRKLIYDLGCPIHGTKR